MADSLAMGWSRAPAGGTAPRTRAEAARRWRTRRRSLLGSPDAVLIVDDEWRIVDANPPATAILKVSRSELVGRSYAEVAVAPDFARALRRRARHRHDVTGPLEPVRRRWCRADGKEIDVELSVTREKGPDGGVLWSMKAVDLSARARTEALLASVVASVSEVAMVSLIDSEGRIRPVTPGLSTRFGYEELVDSLDLCELGIHEDDQQTMKHAFSRWMSGDVTADPVEFRVRHRDGSHRWVSVMAHNYLDDPNVEALVVVAHDITEQRRLESRGEWRSKHDPHSGLINYSAFVERVKSGRSNGEASKGLRFVTCLELPGLRPISDMAGPDVNRRVLRNLARRLNAKVPNLALVARTGEVSLLTLHEGVGDLDAAMEIAKCVLSVGAELVKVEGVSFGLAPKVGVAVDADSSVAPDGLIGEARGVAAAADPGTVEWYDSSVVSAQVARHAAEAELRGAVENRELEVVYQPVIDVVTGFPWSLEALLRWRDPSRGLVSPDEFVPLLEDTGMIHSVGAWVLEEALQQLARWQSDLGVANLGVSVNVSARQLVDRGFPERLRELIDETGVAPGTLCLEMTESIALDGETGAAESLSTVSQLGCILAIDDFGAGYASLSRLAELPFDVMKIDRSLVRGLLEDERQDAIVGAALGMAQALGLHAVAEGVEQPRQLRRLRSLGCHLMQGYLYARPSPAPIMTAWLEAHGTRRQQVPRGPAPEGAQSGGGG